MIHDELIYAGSGECSEQPLSWKLTARQTACIDETWDSGVYGGQPAKVLAYLAGGAK